MRPIKFRAWSKGNRQMLAAVDVSNVHFWDRNDVVLMQFTGMLDKNGKEIYEGDVITIDELRCVVRFGMGSYDSEVYHFVGFYLEHTDPKWGLGTQEENTWWVDEEQRSRREVIGNIYENPELLPTHHPQPDGEKGNG